MVAFSSERGLSLLKDGEVIWRDIKPWFRPNHGERMYLPDGVVSERAACFTDANQSIQLDIRLEEKGSVFALYFQARYTPQNLDQLFQNHLNPDEALGIDIGDILKGTFLN